MEKRRTVVYVDVYCLSLTLWNHSICEVCCGRRETAYGYLWRRA